MPKDQGLEELKQKLNSGPLQDHKDIFHLLLYVEHLSKQADFPKGIKVEAKEYKGMRLGVNVKI